jgi:hypothetical protein
MPSTKPKVVFGHRPVKASMTAAGAGTGNPMNPMPPPTPGWAIS